MHPRNFFAPLAAITVLVLIAFAVLKQLEIPAGTLVDWVIGIGICWWLAGVVTLPWNTHFAAKEVVNEALASREKGIVVKEESIQFARRLSKRFWWIAIILHLVTALVLYGLAYFQITSIGYLASVAALVLTFFRPLQRAYEHLSSRLYAMSHEIRYPREDVYELRNRVSVLEEQLKAVKDSLDVESKESWAYTLEMARLQAETRINRLENELQEELVQNQKAHEQLARQTAGEIAKLSEDAQFLNQVRDLVRFVKNA